MADQALDLDAIVACYANFGTDPHEPTPGMMVADIRDLVREVRRLRAEVATCICQSWPPEGPSAECPVHGAIRAFNEASRALAAAEAARDEAHQRARAEIVAALRAIPWHGAAANAHTHADMIEKGEI